MEIEQIIKLFRTELSKCELYRQEHSLIVVKRDHEIFIAYSTAPCHIEPESTRFDLQTQGKLCHVNHFNIEPAYRRMGHGTALYKSTEEALAKLGCATLALNPSGAGHKFWPKMGFKPCGNELRKTIT